MNNIHRVVWNAACGRWVVASELACCGPRAGQARAAAAPRPLLLALAVSLASIGGAAAQTIQFPGAPVDIGSDTRIVDGVLVANGATGVIVGDGGTLVHQGSDFRIGGTVNNSQQSLDMRGLSNYVFDGAGTTFSVSGSASGGAINTRGVSSGLVNLAAGSNVITASQFGVADRIRNVSGLATNQGTLRLGRYNAINADTVTIGVSQTVGTLNFQDGVTDGTLVLRGSDGSSAVSRWNIAAGSNSNYTGAVGVVDLSGGTLDAKVGALTVATSLFGTASATGTLTLGRGVLEADTVLLGQRSSTSGNGGTAASLNIGAGGTVLANAITMGSRTGTTGTVSSTITLDGGALRAGSILSGAGTATRSIAFNDGVLGNRADGQDMVVDVPIVLAATGSHSFRVDGSDALMAVSGRVSGADGNLTKAGDGVLALTGNNTYSGTTTVNQGLIRFQSGANLGTGRIALDGGGLQWATGNTTDVSARLDALGSNGAVLDTNGNAVTLASALTGDRGQLVKRGDGTLTLTGDNTHTGTTWIEQGTLALGDGGSSGTLAGDIANNAQLVLNRSDRMLLAGSISGSGELVKAGNGTAVLTGNNMHTGGTRVEAGTLQLGDGGSTGNLAGRVTLADGTGLAVDRSDTFLLGADVAGAGALIQAGTGTTVLDGNLTHTGGTTIAAGALRLGNGGTSGSVLGDIDNDGTLELNRSDDFTLANAVRGSGGLVQMGAGSLRIADDQAYTGATRLAAGTLLVDGSIRSDTAVAGGATLGGSGSIHGDVVNAGIVRPGSGTDYGNLTVHGNYVGNNGQLALNTWLGEDGAPSSLLVIDGGNASGSTQVTVNNTNSGEGHTVGNGILVVAATNGGTTQADAFSLSNHARSGALGYQLFRGDVDGQLADNWYLRNSFVVPSPAPDPVDEGGPAPDPVDEGGPAPDPVDGGGSAPEPIDEGVPAPVLPIDPIDPEAPLLPGTYPILGRELATYGVIQPVARDLGLLTLATLRERNGADTRSTDDGAAWVRVTARRLDNGYRSPVAPSAKGELSALQIGSDLWQSGTDNGSSSRLGGYLAHGRSNIDVRGVFSNDDSTAYLLGDTGSLDLQATAAGLSWTTLGTRGGYLDAVVQVTRYSGSATAGPLSLPTRGQGYIASLETGYPFSTPLAHGNFVLAPQLQLIWQQVRFAHSQDAAGAVAVGSTSGLTGRLGVSGTWQLQGAGQVQWSPYVALDYWRHPRAQSTVIYAGKDSLPLEAAASRVVFSAGLKARVSDRFSVFAAGGYERSAGDVQHQQRSSVSANLGLQFQW